MKQLVLLCFLSGILSWQVHGQDMFPVRQLTSAPAAEAFPSWSPAGDSIVYQYTDMADTTGNNGLWKIALDGDGAIQIFSGVAEHPKWSPDGRNIVFDADTGQRIKMIPASGGNALDFLPDSIGIFRGGLPCWSPDGSMIAFIEGSSTSLMTFEFNTAAVKTLYREAGRLPLPGCWSADGKHILVANMNRETRRSSILVVAKDGSGIREITGQHQGFYRYLAVSPDGSLLVYAAMEEGFLGLFIMAAEGGQSLPLTISPGHNEAPVWSPDGTKLAFGSGRAGNGDIWIMDIDITVVQQKLKTLNQ